MLREPNLDIMAQPNVWDTREKRSWRTKLKDPMTLFTAILALATLSLVWVAALQWNTLEKTDETLRAAQRPWIKYSDIQIASPLTYNENGMNITLRFFLKNTGTSPAQNVFPHVFITSNMRNLLDPGEQRRKCEAVRQRPARAIEAGFSANKRSEASKPRPRRSFARRVTHTQEAMTEGHTIAAIVW
jgi:hypothetical protein